MAGAAPKRIILTGVTRGLGRALLDRFVEGGHTVFGCGRSKKAIAALGREHPAPHAFAAVDVSRDDEVRSWVRPILKKHGPPDLLVNNAALINQNAPLWEVSAKEFSDVIDVNIKGVANLIRHVAPSMVERGEGVIVNFSSYWGRSTAPDVAPYCATKWAIEGLTKALANDLPSGMAAVAFNPGIIHTKMLETCFGEDAASYPEPDDWSVAAAAAILRLGPRDNGKSVTAPSF